MKDGRLLRLRKRGAYMSIDGRKGPALVADGTSRCSSLVATVASARSDEAARRQELPRRAGRGSACMIRESAENLGGAVQYPACVARSRMQRRGTPRQQRRWGGRVAWTDCDARLEKASKHGLAGQQLHDLRRRDVNVRCGGLANEVVAAKALREGL